MPAQPKKPIDLAADRAAWDRQPAESEKYYSRFVVFLEMGRARSLKQLAETLKAMGDTAGQKWIYQLSHLNRWDERARAFDTEQDRLFLQRVAARREEMAERHAKLATATLAVAARALKKLDATLEAAPASAADVCRLIDLGTRLERLALGEPGTVVGVSGPEGGPVGMIDYTKLSAEQRQQRMAELAAEAARRAGIDADTMDDDE